MMLLTFLNVFLFTIGTPARMLDLNLTPIRRTPTVVRVLPNNLPRPFPSQSTPTHQRNFSKIPNNTDVDGKRTLHELQKQRAALKVGYSLFDGWYRQYHKRF